MPTFNDARIRRANDRPNFRDRVYVLYWMQAYRRFDRNHALDYALHWARQLKKPLVVYEGLRLDYPWASARHHRFLLEGMVDNARRAEELGINYWPFVETGDQPARGLLRRLSEKACIIVTDDYPAFIVPGQIAALSDKIDVALHAIDGNSLVPLSMLGPAVTACAHLRSRIHKLVAEAWQHRAASEPAFSSDVCRVVEPPFAIHPLLNRSSSARASLEQLIASLPIDQRVQPVAGLTGGQTAGRAALKSFVRDKLPRYTEGRNQPDDPKRTAASGLSPWLRHGHLSIQEVVEAVLGPSWSPARINLGSRGKREGFFHEDPNVNSFLDEAITWRDVGYHWHHVRNSELGIRNAEWKELGGQKIPAFQNLESTLPAWAKASLAKHSADQRDFLYTLEQWEAAATHDPLWNAAQTELMATGRIHNYLRMLWGKKVLEWSATPEEAYLILEHLNNKYAVDGRDPNSYTGILWCFGLFDRPWPPERKVFGNVRYMSSDNTAKKYKLAGYYEYVKTLETAPMVR